MRDFPKEQLQRIKGGRIDTLLMTYPDTGLRIDYNISIDLEGFALHEEDEPFERAIQLTNMPLNGARDWRQISGVYRYKKDEIQGMSPMRNQWLPIDLPFLELRHLGGRNFQVNCELFFDMEVWDDCYRNFTSSFSFEAQFTGYENQKQIFEPEYDLSTFEKIETFVSEHLDISAYKNLKVEDVFVTMEPNEGEQNAVEQPASRSAVKNKENFNH